MGIFNILTVCARKLSTSYPNIIPVNVLPRLELGADALKNCWRENISRRVNIVC